MHRVGVVHPPLLISQGLLPESGLEHHYLRPLSRKKDVDGRLLADEKVPLPRAMRRFDVRTLVQSFIQALL